MLSITNTLSLVLQADKKYFGAIQRVMNSTITILMVMASNQNTIHLKSFNGQNEVLMKMNTHTDCNIAAKGTRKRARIELSVETNKLYLKICQPKALTGMLNTQKLFKGMRFKNFFSYFLLKHILYLLIDVACV